MKRNITLSIDDQTLREAKALGLNISDSAEDGILKRLNRAQLKTEVFDHSLAKLEPENYWIDPKDGQCKERANPQFFINKDGSVIPASKEQYLFWLAHHGKKSEIQEEMAPKDKGMALFNNDIPQN